MAAPDAATALYGAADAPLPRSPGGGPSLLALPPAPDDSPLARVLAGRRSVRDFDAAAPPLPLHAVAQLLWAAQGVTEPPEAPGQQPKGRTVPSAGALFPLEVFLIVGANGVQGALRTHRATGRHVLRRRHGIRAPDAASLKGPRAQYEPSTAQRSHIAPAAARRGA